LETLEIGGSYGQDSARAHKHDFKDRLAEIKVPTLVIGGEEDFFYPIRETAAGIPKTELILYEGFGHNAMFDNSHQFQEDVLAFLNKGASEGS